MCSSIITFHETNEEQVFVQFITKLLGDLNSGCGVTHYEMTKKMLKLPKNSIPTLKVSQSQKHVFLARIFNGQ